MSFLIKYQCSINCFLPVFHIILPDYCVDLLLQAFLDFFHIYKRWIFNKRTTVCSLKVYRNLGMLNNVRGFQIVMDFKRLGISNGHLDSLLYYCIYKELVMISEKSVTIV